MAEVLSSGIIASEFRRLSGLLGERCRTCRIGFKTMSFIAERIFNGAALAACVSAALTFGFPVQAEDAAHTIANKFAEDTASNEEHAKQKELQRTMAELKKKADEARARANAQRQAEETESRRLYEQELLERAREESEATRRAAAEEGAQAKARAEAQAKAKADEVARVAQEKAAREQKRAAEVEAARRAKEIAQAKARAEAEAKAKADEVARVALEKAAREQKRAAEVEAARRAKEVAQAKARAETEAKAKADEVARVALEKATRETKRAAQAEADRRIREAARWAAEATAKEAEAELAAREPIHANHSSDREAQELAERLREARHKYSALGGPTVQSVPARAKPVTVTPAAIRMETKPSKPTARAEQHVTILLIMDVGKRGWRRLSKTADPMLCLHEHCFLSRGSDLPAEKLSRHAAFGPTVALVKRGVSCRSSPSCIFRDIDLETAEAILQPVDLRVLRHDRRETQLIRADKTCDLIRGELVCGHTVGTTDWRAWIVPESVAKRAGPAALEMALESGLEGLD